MIEFFQLILMGAAVGLSLTGFDLPYHVAFVERIRQIATKPRLVILGLGVGTFLGCVVVSGTLHEPVPLVHDEFSYLLIGDTLAHGHVANPVPPLPEFFDTFHVLVHPVYVSKYFPVQGIFLAVGEKLTGHPAVGLWLSSALACAATCWMLQAWIGPVWGMLSGFLMVAQFGVYSYWSQTYWGGMVAALGGALFFGAIRRLWDKFEWQNAVWLSLGLVILANSRPLEGSLAVLPATVLFLRHVWRSRRWSETGFWPRLVLPCFVVLALGAFATGSYNHAITGSAFKTPYALHEQQYQESPPLTFMAVRPRLTYSSFWLQYYYEGQEMGRYLSQRTFENAMIMTARKLMTWWAFYCGALLSTPLVLPGLLRRGWIRYCQAIVLTGFVVVAATYAPRSAPHRFAVDLLAVAQIGLLWAVFDDFWSRLAISTATLLLFEAVFVKWAFPHYYAPTACLILYLQVEGLRRLWHWQSSPQPSQAISRSERRRLERLDARSKAPVYSWRGFVTLFPLVVLISLVLRVQGRINNWSEDIHGPDRSTLLLDDWSLRRADMEKWLEQQPTPQLVFVRYFPYHNVNFEWVFNHADIMHSHVIWARDLGTEHNRLLLQLLPDRTVWLVEGDCRDPQLIPYSESIQSAPMPRESRSPAPDQD